MNKDDYLVTKRGVVHLEIGSEIHTCLRKYCDSKPTTMVYLMVSMPAFRDAWAAFLDRVWVEMDTSDSFPVLLRRAAIPESKNITLPEVIMRVAFEMFKADDWERMAANLIEQEETENQ